MLEAHHRHRQKTAAAGNDGQKGVEKAKKEGTWMEKEEAVDILHAVIDEEVRRLCHTKQSNRVPTQAGGTVVDNVHLLCKHAVVLYWCTRQLTYEYAAACAQ